VADVQESEVVQTKKFVWRQESHLVVAQVESAQTAKSKEESVQGCQFVVAKAQLCQNRVVQRLHYILHLEIQENNCNVFKTLELLHLIIFINDPNF